MIRTFNTHTKTWYLFAETLQILYKERESITNRESTNFEKASINSSILLHLSATLEGAVSSLLYTTLAFSSNFADAVDNEDWNLIRLFRSQLDLIQKSTWSGLSNEISKTVFGFSLSEVNKDSWHAISHLFQFRNILAHGGIIAFDIYRISEGYDFFPGKIEETEEFVTKKELFKFLNEQNLIDNIQDPSVFNWKFINSKVIDFFHTHTKQFLISLYVKYEEKFQLHDFLENDKIAIQRL